MKLAARIEKTRNIILLHAVETPEDYAWREYLEAKEKKRYRLAEFWMNCYIAW